MESEDASGSECVFSPFPHAWCASGFGRGLDSITASLLGLEFWVSGIPRNEGVLFVEKPAGLRRPPAPTLSPHSSLLPACQYCTGFELECPNAFIMQTTVFIKEALGSACKIAMKFNNTESEALAGP